MSMYTYDFQTCGFAIIDEVRAIVESQSEWDHSHSIKNASNNSATAAKRFGFKSLLDEEQKALETFLVDTKAGLHIATYAWGTYANLKADEVDGFTDTSKLVSA